MCGQPGAKSLGKLINVNPRQESQPGDKRVFVSLGSHQVVPRLGGSIVAKVGLCSFWQFLGL